MRRGTVTVMGGYRPQPECFTAITRRANSAKVLGFRTPAKLYVYETILRWRRDEYHRPYQHLVWWLILRHGF
jgi:hypothetical protein